MLKYESLHNHTIESDGRLSALELLAIAEKFNFSTIAITDHDNVPDEAKLAELRQYTGPVKWLIGCEISAGWPKELGGGPASMFHILGLFVDPQSPQLLEHCRRAQAGRETRMEEMVKNLRGLGFTISVEECLAASHGESVGRPHIVQALFAHEENLPIIESLRGQMEEAARHDAGVKRNYDEMMRLSHERENIYKLPYPLFLKEDAFIPGIYVEYSYWLDLDASVRLIRQAGGVAILAHWPVVANRVDAELLLKLLKEGRLDGLETRFRFWGPEIPERTRQLDALVEETGCLATLGADVHEAGDLKAFLANPGVGELSVGQTQRLIDLVKPDLTYSNF